MQDSYHKVIVVALLGLFAPAVEGGGHRTSVYTHGPSAAAYGRGETAVMRADDVFSILYNPALASSLSELTLGACHFPLLDDARYDHLGLGSAGKRWAFAAAIADQASGDVELRSFIDDSPRTLRTHQWQYSATVSRSWQRPFAYACGMTVKALTLDMGTHAGTGFGLDAGLATHWAGPRIFSGNTTFNSGLSVVNAISPSITLSKVQETYAPVLRAGVSWTVPTVYRYASIDTTTVFFEWDREEGRCDPLAGIEYVVAQRYAFRAGVMPEHVTMGFGYYRNGARVDYAIDHSAYALLMKMGVSYSWSRGRFGRERGSGQQLQAEATRAYEEQRVRDAESNALYERAQDEYREGHFLRATELFRAVRMRSPDPSAADRYLSEIAARMMRRSAFDNEQGDYVGIAYARGYAAFAKGDYEAAVREWDKLLMLDETNGEVQQYRVIAANALQDRARQEREKQFIMDMQSLMDRGKQSFDRRDWVSAIRTMEQIQTTCEKVAYPRAAEFHAEADECLKRAISNLSRDIRSHAGAEPGMSHSKDAHPLLDAEGSLEHYRQGLVHYAQGRTAEAIRLWEIALRLDPGNDKAARALDRVSGE